MQLIDISDKNLFVNAAFTGLKAGDLEDHFRIGAEYRLDSERCKVTDIAAMTDEEWDAFTANLMQTTKWLTDRGGFCSDDPTIPDGVEFYMFTEEQQKTFRATCYRLVIAVKSPNRHSIFVDSSGFDYARYVGTYPTLGAAGYLHN